LKNSRREARRIRCVIVSRSRLTLSFPVGNLSPGKSTREKEESDQRQGHENAGANPIVNCLGFFLAFLSTGLLASALFFALFLLSLSFSFLLSFFFLFFSFLFFSFLSSFFSRVEKAPGILRASGS